MESTNNTIEKPENIIELEDTIRKYYTNGNKDKGKALLSKYTKIYNTEQEEINKRKAKGNSRFMDLLVCDLSELISSLYFNFGNESSIMEKLADNTNNIKEYKDSRLYIWLGYFLSTKAKSYGKDKETKKRDKYKRFLINLAEKPDQILNGRGKEEVLDKTFKGIEAYSNILSRYLL